MCGSQNIFYWIPEFARGFARDFNPVRAVDNPVHHLVCNRWHFLVFVPLVDGQLRGDGDGQAACPVIDQIKQILPVHGGQGRQSPVIKDQKPGFVHRCAQFRQATVTPCDLNFLQKPGKSPVHHR